MQAVFFGFGGLTVLGVNTIVIAGPAVIVGTLIGPMVQNAPPMRASLWAALAGGGAIALTAGFVALALALTGQEFVPAIRLVFLAHIPVMIVEALLTAAAVYLAKQAKPELFDDFQGAAQ